MRPINHLVINVASEGPDPVEPLGVFYRIEAASLRLIRVVDGRQLEELP